MKLAILFSALLISLSSCNKSEAELDSEVLAVALPQKADQVKFVKPVIANAQEVTTITNPKIIKTKIACLPPEELPPGKNFLIFS